MAIGTQAIIWASLWYALPDYPPKNPHLNYFSVFGTMAKFLFTNPVLGMRITLELLLLNLTADLIRYISARVYHKRTRFRSLFFFLGHVDFPPHR